MPTIQIRRGLRANIPSTAANGELILTTDDQQLSVGNVAGNGVVPIKIAASNVTGLVAAPVSSVFGRTGAVAAAANDYSFSQVSGTLAGNQLPATIDGGTF